ncbi:MAG: hypothetical protein EA347_05055 [Thioalkalivibrio sp.]|nr:MAG: hypothetical protein EA347_05055 [Thioalkalivibrio sp.]
MEALVVASWLPQVVLLALVGFVAFYSSCAVGIRAGWLAYHPSVCGSVGAAGGAAMGILTATL